MALFFYKEKNKDIRAAAYLRLSIEDGDKAESNSIGNQRELIRDFAAERPGLHLVEEYADDGYTGTNFERPGFKRMMEDSRKTKLGRVEWNPGTLAGVLANERHCGDVLARKTFTPNFLTHQKMGWDSECRYKMLGYRITFEGETLYVFDLLVPEIFHEGQRKKNAVDSQDNAASTKPVNSRKGFYLDDIVGTCGVPVEEHRKESEVKQMDGYVSMGILTGKIAPEAGKD